MNTIFWSVSALTQIFFVSPFNVKQASFTLPKIGQKLIGKELQTKHTTSTFFCAQDCVRMDECFAFNYDENEGTCQLMETNDMSNAEPDPNYQVILKKVTCAAEPCMYGAACHDRATPVHDDRGFRCSCPCGRCGKRCENLHFGLTKGACIAGYNAGYKKVTTPDECIDFCWDTPGCKSVDYFSESGDCWLNSVTTDEEPLALNCDEYYPGVVYIFFNCTCDE